MVQESVLSKSLVSWSCRAAGQQQLMVERSCPAEPTRSISWQGGSGAGRPLRGDEHVPVSRQELNACPLPFRPGGQPAAQPCSRAQLAEFMVFVVCICRQVRRSLTNLHGIPLYQCVSLAFGCSDAFVFLIEQLLSLQLNEGARSTAVQLACATTGRAAGGGSQEQWWNGVGRGAAGENRRGRERKEPGWSGNPFAGDDMAVAVAGAEGDG